MTLVELLSLISNVAKGADLSTPYICGGTPRDKFMQRVNEMVDLDLTTGDDDVHRLAQLVANAVPNSNYKRMDDGHAQVMVGDFKLDFSSNYRSPNVEGMLVSAGIPKPTEMQLELYSRDFTCNALLMTLDLKTIIDPTGLAIGDISKKLLRTCLPAGITLSQHKRVVRVLYLAAKLGFTVDKEIIDWVKSNPATLANVKPKYLATKLQAAIDADKEKTVQLLDQMGLWRYVPPLPDLIPYMGRPGRV